MEIMRIAVNSGAGQVRRTSSKVAATTPDGDLQTIPPQQVISFYKTSRDWRRVTVHWNGVPVQIALTSWESAVDVETEKRRRR
jgi:hypothetical protein